MADQAAAKLAAMELQQKQDQEGDSCRVKEHQAYYQRRVDLFTKYKERQTAALEAAKAANVPIRVVLPDGGGAWGASARMQADPRGAWQRGLHCMAIPHPRCSPRLAQRSPASRA